MYCGDNQGTDVDHFEPIALAPLRTFDWPNHMLACSLCNSHYKRHLFPYDEEGRALLVDPTVEEPLNHLHLVRGTGQYIALSPQGEASIDVFRLNRGSLVKGRLDAYVTAMPFLAQWRAATDKGRTQRACDIVRIAGTAHSPTCSRRCSTSPHCPPPRPCSRRRTTCSPCSAIPNCARNSWGTGDAIATARVTPAAAVEPRARR